MAYILAVPPQSPSDSWRTVGGSLAESLRDTNIHAAVLAYADILAAFQTHSPDKFNTALEQYNTWMAAHGLSKGVSNASLEFLFNGLQPFYVSMVIYVMALVLGCIFWVKMDENIRRSGYALLILGFIIHSTGLFCRMYIQGRPPVTNLYSSAIFIGWGSVLLGIFLERIFKGGIGLVCTAFIGFISLIIAHHLALSGDTMEMLRAVLDTNLWLATHVVTITIGYCSMFVAGVLAIIYIVRGRLTKTLTPEMATALVRMVYGIICFSTLFSFVGTVLGGIWGDQAWGRFWGWDNKENGALLIVLWNAAILHARWSGMIKDRGLMAMAVFGNVVTCFSWFVVNMLGVGLHAYGFMDAAFPWIIAFDISQLIVIGLALTPKEKWASRI
jgi:ABC-type transport system involved in cytochrome c biogenesis permease subunit